MNLSRLSIATALAVTLPTVMQHSAADPTLPSFAEPSISPDRSEIAFASGGDIWVVPSRGGQAHLLISHTATEGRPKYSPDGKRLAFTSTRNGSSDIYVMDLASGDIKRLTYDDGAESLDNWSADSKWVYFSSSSRDVSGANDLWRISADGGTPMQVSADRYASEYWGAPSPDGSSVAFTARGTVSGQWWRHGHSHIDESEIWLMKDGATPTYTRIGESGGGKDAWPMWSADGKTVYYMSDRSGAENLYSRPASGGAATKLTSFTDGRVLWPSISADGKTIVFERDFGIWSYDVDGKRASPVSITLRGAAATPGIDHLTLSTGMQGMTLSPDAKKVAFTVRGEVFAIPARDGGSATRVTDTPAIENGLIWTPDSRRVIYASDRDGVWHLFSYDFASHTETQLTRGTANDLSPRISPDGLKIVYMHGARELHVMDFTGANDRLLASGYFDHPPFLSDRLYAWSPDSRWVAYITGENGGYSNTYIVSVTTAGEPRPVSFLPNANSGTVQWSPDGTYLLMETSQRTEDNKLVRIDLIPRTPRFREDQFRDLFGPTPPVPASPPPVQQQPARDTAATPRSDSTPTRPNRRQTQIVFDGIRQRVSILPLSVSVGQFAVSPDGKSLVISGFAAGQGNLYLWPMDESSDAPPVLRQITSTPGGKGQVQWSPDSKEVWYVEGGRLSAVNVDSRNVRTVNYTAEMDVDWSKEKMEVFNQGWSYLRDNFFDPNFHGIDWNATRLKYEPYVAGSHTPDEMRRVMSLMIGELNASHMGVNGPGSPAVTGRIGARFDRAEYETNGKLKITEVLPLSPLAIAGAKVGDYITAVDRKPITNRTNLDDLLMHKTGKQVVISLSSNGVARDVTVKPVNAATEKGLIYKNWVDGRRAYVEKVSNGRLGYVHMIDMNQGTLDQFILDLDTQTRAHEGVVVDIRNNNGGFVNGYALDVLARRGYLGMQSRDYPKVPARTALGQRALELPTILVVNQQTLSDGEDFTEGYRSQQLGKVVGEPTAGWIIFTSNVGLIDGQTVIRLPSTRITDAEGKDMEMHPRPVDVLVQRPIGESYTGTDVQLDAAVRELLAQIAARKR